jgi:type IV pilus assembly protein PilE
MNKRGFTLIELLVVITIIGILGGIAITSYIGVTLKAARSEAYSNLEALRLLEEQFFAENGNYAGPAANTAAIQALLPGFRPGAGASFTFAITSVAAQTSLPAVVAVPYNGATTTALIANPNTPCFIVTATGLPNTRVGPPSRVPADVFAIDCMNNRNF